jgi:hypothetical protein
MEIIEMKMKQEVLESIGIPPEHMEGKKFFVLKYINEAAIKLFATQREVVYFLHDELSSKLSVNVNSVLISSDYAFAEDLPANIEFPCYRLMSEKTSRFISCNDPKVIQTMIDVANTNRGGVQFAYGEIEVSKKTNKSKEEDEGETNG